MSNSAKPQTDDELDKLEHLMVLTNPLTGKMDTYSVFDKQAIKANYRHIDDIRGAIPEKQYRADEDGDMQPCEDFNQAIDDIRQALNIGDK